MRDLKKEAYDYACINVPTEARSHDTYFRNIQTAYIDGATEITKELQAENKLLRGQLDKMYLEKANAQIKLDAAEAIIKTYVQLSLQESEKRKMTEEIELFKKAEAFINNRG